eukprot:33368-Eustigmatos_ZCMA.PRE.1
MRSRLTDVKSETHIVASMQDREGPDGDASSFELRVVLDDVILEERHRSVQDEPLPIQVRRLFDEIVEAVPD